MPDTVSSYLSAQWWLFLHIGLPFLAVVLVSLAIWAAIERNQ